MGNLLVKSWENCASSAGLSRALEISRAACIAVSADESAVIVTVDGKKATVLHIRSEFVSGMYIVQQG